MAVRTVRYIRSLAIGVSIALLVAAGLWWLNREPRLSEAETAAIHHVVFELPTQREDARRLSVYQSRRAQCMAAAGFSADVDNPQESRIPRYDTRMGLPDKSFAHQWGFGIFTDQEIEDYEFAGKPEGGQAGSLGGPDLESRYYSALFGPWRKDADGGYIQLDPRKGCAGQALKAANPITYYMNNLPAAARQSLREMHGDVVGDAEVVSANKSWRSCMKEHGYDLGDSTYESIGAWLQSRKQLRKIGERTVSPARDTGNNAQQVAVPVYDPASLADAIAFEKMVAESALSCGDLVGLNGIVRGEWKTRQDFWIDRYAKLLQEGAALEVASRPGGAEAV